MPQLKHMDRFSAIVAFLIAVFNDQPVAYKQSRLGLTLICIADGYLCTAFCWDHLEIKQGEKRIVFKTLEKCFML